MRAPSWAASHRQRSQQTIGPLGVLFGNRRYAHHATSLLDLLDLANHQAEPRDVALQFGRDVWRERRALRRVEGCQTLRRLAQGWCEVTNAEPGQRALYAVHKPRAFLNQALALPIGPLGVLFGNRRYAQHAAMAPFSAQRVAITAAKTRPCGALLSPGQRAFHQQGPPDCQDYVQYLDP